LLASEKPHQYNGVSQTSNIDTLSLALEYRESLGGEDKIQEYCGNLARRGGELVANILGTDVLENEEKSLTALMVNVRLPIEAHDGDGYYLDRFLDEGAYKYKCFAPAYKYHGVWYTRLSAQVYMEESDFKKAAHVLKEICEQLEKERLEGKK
jgi:selenocysteine lyase/cysteine desulfurase